ncbi:MAG: hypothetical protein HYW48_00595 [Deltaproteobacteria bacterium]|nr:hypothetical protein [Deltaproteobacteria bacterium]
MRQAQWSNRERKDATPPPLGDRARKSGESSFTLLETIIALGLMVVMILEVSTVQGSAINLSQYERKVTQAVWLGKAILGQIEYKWKFYEVKEIKEERRGERFDEKLCPRDGFDCDFTYDLTVEEWKLPLIELAAGSLGDKSMTDMIKGQLKDILGDEVLKIAHIEVFWPEGAKRNSVDLAYLITAQQKLDTFIETLQPVGVKKEEVKKDEKQIKDEGEKKCKPEEELVDGQCVPKD